MKVRNFVLVGALFVGLSNLAGVAMAQAKVLVVNEQKVRAESKLGKALDAALQELAVKGVDQLGLKTLQTEVQTEAAALKPQTQSLTREALESNPTLKARVEGLNKKAGELQQKQNVLNATVEKQDTGYNYAFYAVMIPAVDAVAKEAGADVVLSYPSTLYTKDSIDISAKVIARLDATVPTMEALKAALPAPPAKPAGGGQ
jgi:Skp family chaperone for outer membrane proteins